MICENANGFREKDWSGSENPSKLDKRKYKRDTFCD